jgi:hypothetical protein
MQAARPWLARFAWCTFLALLTTGGYAQWTFVNLHVEGAEETRVSCVKDGRQAGLARFGETWHAGYWEGTSSSWVDLHVAGAYATRGLGIDEGLQVGSLSPTPSGSTAALWSGTPESFISLHPAGVEYSAAVEADNGQQVGLTRITQFGDFRAALWAGTAESFVELHPIGATYSYATSVRNGVQTGYASFGSGTRAGIWQGTKESFVSIHPAGYNYSEAYDISDDQQVGFVWEMFMGRNAAVWSGTAESFVNLRPNSFSTAHGVDSGVQVGVVSFPLDEYKASLWYGTANSYIDLDAYVPPEFQDSEANDVMVENDRTYVVGSVFGKHGEKGAMWISQAIHPLSFSLFRGILVAGNLDSLRQSDDVRLVIRPGVVFSTNEPPVQARVDATATAAAPSGFSFSIESSASFMAAEQTIALWNFTFNGYEIVDTRLVSISDDITHVTVQTDPGRFIETGSLALRAVVRYRAVGPSFAYPWSARIDRVWWTFPG